MCKLTQNGARPAGRLIYIMVYATLCFGLFNVYSPASDKTDGAGIRLIANGQLNPEQDSLIPRPDLEPVDVVRIQLDALANNNDPYSDAGIEITFRFASPSNQQATGPLSRFISMLYNPLYSPMLEHQSASYWELVTEIDRAMQSVILTGADGRRVAYVFVLSKQKSGPFEQCWMTDSVLRFEVDSV